MIANNTKQLPQILYSSGLPNYQGPDFSFGGFYSRKQLISAGDNLTKTWKQHTIKLGVFYERTANNQLSPNGATQGAIAIYGTYTNWYSPYYQNGMQHTGQTGNSQNVISDLLFGEITNYSQQNFNPLVDMNYMTLDGYVTDNWKVNRKLTLDLGVRFDHLGPWMNTSGIGGAYWYPQKYSTPSWSTILSTSTLPGILWHGIDSSVPESVQLGRWAFVSPRVGFAYYMYGDGKTVFNGGAGMYRSHDSNNYAGAVGTTQGATQYSYTGGSPTLYCLDALGKNTAQNDLACTNGSPVTAGSPATPTSPAVPANPAPTVSSPFNVSASSGISTTAVDPNDSQQPLTLTFAFGVTQQLSHAGNLVINYSGNKSNHLLTSANINPIPMGGLFAPDPNINSPYYGATQPADGVNQIDDFRPYPFYNSLNILRHGLISNYNSLQTTWSKWVGPMHYNLNYTWSKAMTNSGQLPDQTNLRNDYTIAGYDRTHVFNASYTYIEGSPFHVERFVGGFINGWEISGITNIQSGPNLQSAYGNNFGLSTVSNCPAGGNCSTSPCPAGTICNTLAPTDNKSYLGTPDITLQPVMTCDPSTGLKHNQFVNPSCLTLGQIGVNGPFHYPYIRGPHYFNSDLSVQKTFKMGDKKTVDFRFSAFNFMNQPPLTSLTADAAASPLRLVVGGPGQPANSAFGTSDYKENRRVCEVGLHYNF